MSPNSYAALSPAVQALVDWAVQKFALPSTARTYFTLMAENLKTSHPHRSEVYREAADYLQ